MRALDRDQHGESLGELGADLTDGYIRISLSLSIYIYIYIYIWALSYPPCFWKISVFSWFLTNPEAQSHVIYDIM